MKSQIHYLRYGFGLGNISRLDLEIIVGWTTKYWQEVKSQIHYFRQGFGFGNISRLDLEILVGWT